MTKYFFVTTSPLRNASFASRPCDSVEDALRGAKFMLGNGAANVSIVDNRGCVVLPADEVSLYSGRVSSLAHEDVFAPFPTSVLSKFVAASGARRRLEVFEPAHA